MLSVDNAALRKKLNQTDKLRTLIATKYKEISNLTVALDTKDKLLELANVPNTELVIEAIVQNVRNVRLQLQTWEC